MTTTTSEPQRSGPGTPPVVGMVVRWDRPTTTGFPPREFATQDIVVTRTDSLFVWCNGHEFGFDRKDWDAGTLAIISSPSRPDKREEEIDWARFVPAAELPDTGAKTFHVGEAWAGHDGVYRGTFAINSVDSRGEASVRWHTRYHRERLAHDYEEVLMVDGYVRNARLVRHADGRWADGYGPNGPIDPACRDAAKPKAPTSPYTTITQEMLNRMRPGEIVEVDSIELLGMPSTWGKPAPQPAPWKCKGLAGKCETPGAPPHHSWEVCVCCGDKLDREACDSRDKLRTPTKARLFDAAPMLPGTAHALAVAGARTWRRPTSYVPLDDPTGGDL
jgi:hypothetical protein